VTVESMEVKPPCRDYWRLLEITWYFSARPIPSFSFSRPLSSERVFLHVPFRWEILILPAAESWLSLSRQPSTRAIPFMLVDCRESSWFLLWVYLSAFFCQRSQNMKLHMYMWIRSAEDYSSLSRSCSSPFSY